MIDDIIVNELPNSEIKMVEIIINNKATPRMLHESTKGLYFIFKSKRIYAYEYKEDGLRFCF